MKFVILLLLVKLFINIQAAVDFDPTKYTRMELTRSSWYSHSFFYQYFNRFSNAQQTAKTAISPRIIGGAEVSPKFKYPFMCALYVTASDGNFFCGCILVSFNVVLTAAHCVESASKVVVRLGAHDIKAGEVGEITREVTGSNNIIPHPNYSSMFIRHDIAVIKTDVPKNIDNIKPVQIAVVNESYKEGYSCIIIGWGKVSDNSTGVSNYLKEANINVAASSCCSSYGILSYSENRQICLNTKQGTSSCNGDSGGPLIVIINGVYKAIGVTSYGSSAGCEKGYCVVYTKIGYYYTSFIQQYMT